MSSVAADLAYPVLERAREAVDDRQLMILQNRKWLGIPLAADIRGWLAQQPPATRLILDFTGIEAVTVSVAEEIGPVLMQLVAQDPTLEHRYPVYRLPALEPAYTFHRLFSSANWNALAEIVPPEEMGRALASFGRPDGRTFSVLGDLTPQTLELLQMIDARAQTGESTTSEQLDKLDFLSETKIAARSKRLSELHSRRLLAYRRNPRELKERMFTPVWRLNGDDSDVPPGALP